MKLTPEDLQRIEEKKVANILRKIYTEKRTPTAREDAILHRAGLVQTPGTLPLAGYAGNWDELSRALGVSRRAIQEWRKDPRYGHDAPADRADGRKEIAAWQAFMVRHALKRADESVGGIADDEDAGGDAILPPRIGGTQADWKTANLALDHRRKENEVLVFEETLLVAADLEVPLGATFAAIQTKLSQFPARVARYLRGLTDVGEIEEKLRDEIDADLGDLHAARFTAEDAIAAAVEAVPFDAETEALCQKLLFAGADRPALLALAAAIARQAVRSLGQRALAPSPTQPAPEPERAVVEQPADPEQQQQQPAGDEARAEITVHASPPPSAEAEPPAKADRTEPLRNEDRSPRARRPRHGPAKPAPAADPIPSKESGSPPRKGRRRKPRPEPAKGPAEVEAMIVEAPRKKTRRHRR